MKKIKLIQVGNYIYKCLKDGIGEDLCVCINDPKLVRSIH